MKGFLNSFFGVGPSAAPWLVICFVLSDSGVTDIFTHVIEVLRVENLNRLIARILIGQLFFSARDIVQPTQNSVPNQIAQFLQARACHV